VVPPKRRKSLLIAALGGVVSVAGVGAAVAATVPALTVQINKTATIAATKSVSVSGVIECKKGDRYHIAAVLVQKASGAYASASYPESKVQKTCSGGADRWIILLKPKTASFKPGTAEMCVLASTQTRKVGATGLAQSCNSTLTLAASK
jgi:hypothetical protein